jgi:hypothetical protein
MLHRLSPATYLMLLLMIAACRNPPNYPDEPVIEFLSMNKNTMQQGFANQDQILMTISFTDGDGDLGSNNNEDSTKVYFADTRYPIPEVYTVSIPLVPELGSGNGISGDITFRVGTSCCLYNGASTSCMPIPGLERDTIVYDIYIIDRKGNQSNVVKSDPVILLCQ